MASDFATFLLRYCRPKPLSGTVETMVRATARSR